VPDVVRVVELGDTTASFACATPSRRVGDGRSEAEARALLAAEPPMTGRSLADAVSG